LNPAIQESRMATLQVVIYLFPDVEVLDFAGPFEVFSTASRVAQRLSPAQPAPFQVSTVARSHRSVRARAGLQVLPSHDWHDCPRPDLLLIPGGVVDAELGDSALLNWLRDCATTATTTASVCTGAFILAAAGLLDGRRATTHWEDADELRERYPAIRVEEQRRWIDHGDIATSAGIAAGIDLSLHLVARLAGRLLAERTARQMDVPYRTAP
jgi:transcriptional regulator GlxA family with amidase domain